jgi:DNA (cytosine-5)-methyltransferase 1
VAGDAPTALSLYAGAGGLDQGFKDAGFELAWAVDADEHAVETYRANLGEHAVCGELPGVAPPRELEPDVIIGGPPCQGFSVIGRMDPADPRSRHVFSFLDVVEQLKPAAFCMENVKALAVSARWEAVRQGLVRRARRLGYHVELLLLNAADYGVPQARERMFLIGARDEAPSLPPPTTKGAPVTVREALRALPPYGEPGNDTACTARVVVASRPVMRPSAHRGSLLFNGVGRPLELDSVAKTLPAAMGGNATPIIDQEELASGADSWVAGYHRRLLEGGAPEEIPPRIRRVTVEEASALQTFPAGWTWKGPQGARYRQIGNAVPPRLAYHVALSLRAALARRAIVPDGAPTAEPIAA